MKRIVAFFGAFNPPTLAHIQLAQRAYEASGREGALFVPSKSAYIRNSQKKGFAFSDEERLKLLGDIASTRPWMRVTDWEMKQPDQPRTYRTLCHLRDEGYEPALLIGSDKLKEMDKSWLFVEEMAREFGIVCLHRGEDDLDAIIESSARLRPLKQHILLVDAPEGLRSISSSLVRSKLDEMRRLRQELSALVPEEIVNEIQYAYAKEDPRYEA